MEEQMDINLREVFKALLKSAWIIMLCAVLVGGAVLAYTVNFVTPMYQSHVTLYVNNGSNESGTVSSGTLAVQLQLVNSYVAIIESDTVLEKVISDSGFNLNAKDIREMLTAEPVDETEMFRVKITSPDPQMSADIANAVAKVAPSEISKIIEGSSAKVIDYAKVSTSRSSPSYTTNAIVGALVGALLASAVVVLGVCLDMRVKSEEELIKICAIPVLGAIPDFAQMSKEDEKRGGRRA